MSLGFSEARELVVRLQEEHEDCPVCGEGYICVDLKADETPAFVHETDSGDHGEWCEYSATDETAGVVMGFDSDEVIEGQKIATSPISGNTYRVTRWVFRGRGRIIALEKELLEGEEVRSGGGD